MKEFTITPEVHGKIASLRELAVSGASDPEQLAGAWETYLEIKEGTITRPIDTIAVSQVRTMVDVLKKGGTYEHNSTTISAVSNLRGDLGIISDNGLIGKLDESEMEKVETFADNMADILIRKA